MTTKKRICTVIIVLVIVCTVCVGVQRSVQTYFRQKRNLFLSQEKNKIALATHSFSSQSSQGFKSFSSQVTPYGAPPEV